MTTTIIIKTIAIIIVLITSQQRCEKSAHLVLQNIIQCKFNINSYLINTLNCAFCSLYLQFYFCVFLPATIKISMLYCKSPLGGARTHPLRHLCVKRERFLIRTLTRTVSWSWGWWASWRRFCGTQTCCRRRGRQQQTSSGEHFSLFILNELHKYIFFLHLPCNHLHLLQLIYSPKHVMILGDLFYTTFICILWLGMSWIFK